MSLLTYQDARPYASRIKERTQHEDVTVVVKR